jgi:hypothetical protein
MRAILLALPLVTLTAASALAQDDYPKFVRTGDAYVCQQSAGKPAADAVPCLTYGSLKIGMSQTRLERLAGPKVQESDKDGKHYIFYPLTVADPAQATDGTSTTLVVSYGKSYGAAIIQILGPQPDGDWHIQGVALGDTGAVLKAKIGDALEVQPGANGDENWVYSPDLSFGLHNGVISVVRLSKPADAK